MKDASPWGQVKVKYNEDALKGLNFNNANESRRPAESKLFWFRQDKKHDREEQSKESNVECGSHFHSTSTKETLLEGNCRGVIRSEDHMIVWETQDSDYLKVELFNRISKSESSTGLHLPTVTKDIDAKQSFRLVKEVKREILPPINTENSAVLNSRRSGSSVEVRLDQSTPIVEQQDHLRPSPHIHRDKISKLRNILVRTPAEVYFERLKRHLDETNTCNSQWNTSHRESRHLQQSVKMLNRYHEALYGAKRPTLVKLPKITKQTRIVNRGQVAENRTTKYRRKMGKWFCIKCDKTNCSCPFSQDQQKTQQRKDKFKWNITCGSSSQQVNSKWIEPNDYHFEEQKYDGKLELRRNSED